MVKINEIKRLDTNKRSKIKVKDLIIGIRKKLNKEKVEKVSRLLETKYRQLDDAEQVVRKLNKQITDIENDDIENIDTSNYVYE